MCDICICVCIYTHHEYIFIHIYDTKIRTIHYSLRLWGVFYARHMYMCVHIYAPWIYIHTHIRTMHLHRYVFILHIWDISHSICIQYIWCIAFNVSEVHLSAPVICAISNRICSNLPYSFSLSLRCILRATYIYMCKHIRTMNVFIHIYAPYGYIYRINMNKYRINMNKYE